MNNNADANKVIGRYREQVAGFTHQLILMETLREQDAETIEELKQENEKLRSQLSEPTESASSEAIEG